jgi:hypothetical protein
MNAPAKIPVPARLALRIGRTRRLVEVASYAEASRFYAELRDRSGRGASTMPEGRIYDAETEKLVAVVSYNGRIWQGERSLFDPFEAEVRA